MSSCAASCCMYSPKASSAFATSVSSPTAGVPLCCRFAGKRSARYNRKLNQKHPQPMNPACFGFVPTVVGQCGSSNDLPLPNSNSVLHRTRLRLPHETAVHNTKTSRAPSRSAPVRLLARPIPPSRFSTLCISDRFARLPDPWGALLSSAPPRSAQPHPTSHLQSH